MTAQLPYATLKAIFARFAEMNAEPQGELHHTNAFTLLVAVALSAQATDAGVNRATARLFPIADTPEKMLALGEERLIEHIRTIGLYRNKAKNVIKLSQRLIDEYGGEVPSSRAALMTLPGVGRKTANVVLGDAFGVPGITPDTHLIRVSNRLGWVSSTKPNVVEDAVGALFPPHEWVRLNHRIIWHGRRRCHARRPACGVCDLAAVCPSFGEGPTDPEIAATLVREPRA